MDNKPEKGKTQKIKRKGKAPNQKKTTRARKKVDHGESSDLTEEKTWTKEKEKLAATDDLCRTLTASSAAVERVFI